LLIVCGTWAGLVSAEDAPPPPSGPPLERLFGPVREQLEASSLPPFLRDMDLRVHFRTYYFNRMKPDDSKNEALATGGWLSLQSGWLFDTFAMGATLYGSAPLYAPDDRDGTLLLKPGQEGYYVPGEAWGAVRYKDYALLKGYRQLVDQGYINPQDSRMTPNTFEAVTVGGKVGWLQYLAGYLWNIKTRNSDDFVAMSSAAGVKGQHDGVGLVGVRLTPREDLKIDVSNQYGIDMFNTLYAEATYLHRLTEDWQLRVGLQITDQRAVGHKDVPGTVEKFWTTQTGGVRVQAIFRELTLTGAFSVTGGEQPSRVHGELSRLPLDDRSGLQPRQREGLAGRRRLRLLEADHPWPERQLQCGLGPRCHQPVHAAERAQPVGVRLHGRLSLYQERAGLPPGRLVPGAQRHPRSAECREARLPVPLDHQLGKGPDLMPEARR
jgi:hypothetical protein